MIMKFNSSWELGVGHASLYFETMESLLPFWFTGQNKILPFWPELNPHTLWVLLLLYIYPLSFEAITSFKKKCACCC